MNRSGRAKDAGKQDARLQRDIADVARHLALLRDDRYMPSNRAAEIKTHLVWAYELGFAEGKQALRQALLDAEIEGAEIELGRGALAAAMRRTRPARKPGW